MLRQLFAINVIKRILSPYRFPSSVFFRPVCIESVKSEQKKEKHISFRNLGEKISIIEVIAFRSTAVVVVAFASAVLHVLVKLYISLVAIFRYPS